MKSVFHRTALRAIAAIAAFVLTCLCAFTYTAQASGETYTVTVTAVNIRKQATTDSAVLATLSNGETVSVTGTSGDWYKVTYNSASGYIRKDMLTKNSATATVTGSSVFIRRSASHSGSVIDKVSRGTVLTAISRADNWVKVTFNGATGYISAEYVDVRGLPTPNSSDEPLVSMSATGRVNATGLLVRKDASASARSISKLDKNDSVNITGKKGEWYRVKVSEGTGYVLAQYITLSGDKSSTSDATVTDMIGSARVSGGTVNVRKSATKDSALLYQLDLGNAVTITGKCGSWYRVSTSKGTGFVMSQYLSSLYCIAASRTLQSGQTGSDVKALQERLKALGYLTVAPDGEFGEYTLTAVRAFQKKVGLKSDGIVGHSTLKALFSADAPKYSPAQQYHITSVLMSGSSGSQVKALQQRLKELGYFSDAIDGQYGTSTVKAVMLYQTQAGLTVDGIAGTTTVKQLLSTGAKKYDGVTKVRSLYTAGSGKVYNVDWWTGGIQDIFTRGTIATVTDVKTGLTFKVKRRGGHNHADVEPLDSESTAALRKCYGGSWSWDRRAILVTVNGRTYAASMNGMPHGNSSISNGFSGHFCIHFLNSRTHGGNNWDESHQSCIAYAFKQGNK